jgi:hypothetical protein
MIFELTKTKNMKTYRDNEISITPFFTALFFFCFIAIIDSLMTEKIISEDHKIEHKAITIIKSNDLFTI